MNSSNSNILNRALHFWSTHFSQEDQSNVSQFLANLQSCLKEMNLDHRDLQLFMGGNYPYPWGNSPLFPSRPESSYSQPFHMDYNEFAGPNHYPEPAAPRMPYYAHHPPPPHRSHISTRGGPWQEHYHRNHPPQRRRHHLDDIYLENYDEEETHEEGHHPAYRPPIRVTVQTTKPETVTKEQPDTNKTVKNEGPVEAQSKKPYSFSKKEERKCTNEIASLKINKNNKAISKESRKIDESFKGNTSNNKIVKEFPKPKSDFKGPGEKQNILYDKVKPPTGQLGGTIRPVPLSKDTSESKNVSSTNEIASSKINKHINNKAISKESQQIDESIKGNNLNNANNKIVKEFPKPKSDLKGPGKKQNILSDTAKPPTGSNLGGTINPVPLSEDSSESKSLFINAKTESENTSKNDLINKSNINVRLKDVSPKNGTPKIPLSQTSEQGNKILELGSTEISTIKNKDKKLEKPDPEKNNILNSKDCRNISGEVKKKIITKPTEKKKDESETDIVKELEELVGLTHNDENENTSSNLIKKQQKVFHQKEGVKEAVVSNAQNALKEHASPNTTFTNTNSSPKAIKKDIKINLIRSPQPKSPITNKISEKNCSTSESTTDRPVNIRNEIKTIINNLSFKRFNLSNSSVTPISTDGLLEGTKIQETNKTIEGSNTQETNQKSVFLEDIFILEDEIKNIDGPCETIVIPSSPTENDSSGVSVDNKINSNSCEKFKPTSDKTKSSSKIMKEKLVEITDNTQVDRSNINNNPSNGSTSPIIINIESPDGDSRSPTNLEIRKTFEQNGRPLEDFRNFDTRDSFLWTFHQQFDDPRVVDMDISNTPSPSKNLISTEEPAKTEQQKVSDRVIQDMDALWKEISNNKSDNSNSGSEVSAILKPISMADRIREKIKRFKSQIIEKNLELVNARESSLKEKEELKTLENSGNSPPKKTKLINDDSGIDTNQKRTFKITKQFLKNDLKLGNQNKRNDLQRSSSFVEVHEKTFKAELRKTKSCNDLNSAIKVDLCILPLPNDINAKISGLCINESKISCSLTSPKKVLNVFSDYRDELLSLLSSKSSENILESSDEFTKNDRINDKIKVKKRKRAMRIESSDDEAPEEKRITLKNTELVNENDTKIKYNEKTKENQTQQIRQDDKTRKQTAPSQEETLLSTESEKTGTKIQNYKKTKKTQTQQIKKDDKSRKQIATSQKETLVSTEIERTDNKIQNHEKKKGSPTKQIKKDDKSRKQKASSQKELLVSIESEKTDAKIQNHEETKENHTQQMKNNEKSKEQSTTSQKETSTSTECEQQPTKYLTKAEYVKAFAKNKSPVPDISLSISAVPKLQNIKKRRATFTCETDNETILKKINSELHYKQKFLRLFGSVSEDEEDIVPLPAGTAKTFRESETSKEGNTGKSNEKLVNDKEKEGLSESSDSSNGVSRPKSKKQKRFSDGSASDCKRKKHDIEPARSNKEKGSIKNQESLEQKNKNLPLISSDKNKEISNHRRSSTSSTASTDSKSRDGSTKNVIKDIKLLKDAKRVARSQSQESDTCMLSDTGRQENKQKEKLDKFCVKGRRESSSSNASSKSESDQHNKQKDTKNLPKKVEKCKKLPTKLKESNQTSPQRNNIMKNEKEHKESNKNQTKDPSASKSAIHIFEVDSSTNNKKSVDIKLYNKKQQQTYSEADKKNSKLLASSETKQSHGNVPKKNISLVESSSSSTKTDEKVKPKPLNILKEYHRRYSAPDTLDSFYNKKSSPVYKASENEVIITFENCRSFVPDIPKCNKITKITRVDNECTDMAYVNEKPDTNSKVETVIQFISKDDDDVIEIRPTIPMIDLTEDRRASRENSPEKIIGNIKLKTENITDEVEDSTNTITLYRSEEDNSNQDKEVQPMSVSLSPAATEKIVSLKKNVQKPNPSKEFRSVPLSNAVAKEGIMNAEVNNTQNTPNILENSNMTASAAAAQSFSSLVQDLDINSDIRDESNSVIRENGSSDATDKSINLSNSQVEPESAIDNASCLQPQEKLMSLDDENQRAITSILEVTNTNQILLGNKNTQGNITEPSTQPEQTILNFTLGKTTKNISNHMTDALFAEPSNVFKRPQIIVRPTRAEIQANSPVAEVNRSTLSEATANQNSKENQSSGQHRGLPQTLKEHRPVQKVKVTSISTPPGLLNMNLPQTSSHKSNMTGPQIQLVGTSRVLNSQNVSHDTNPIIEGNRSETVQNKSKNSGADKTGESEEPVIDLTEDTGELSLIDKRLIIDIFTRHLYFLAHLCKAQNGYIEYLRTQPHCQNYFKAEIALFEEQKQARLLSQSLRLVTELHYLNIRASRNLSTTASEIVEQITLNLSARNMPKQITLSMTYLLIGQLIRPQSENFAKIPIFKALYRLCNIVISKIYSKYPCQLTEEQRKMLIQQINDYNRMIVGSSVSSVDQPRSQSNAQTLNTGLNNPLSTGNYSINTNNQSNAQTLNTGFNNPLSTGNYSINTNNTPASSRSIENNQFSSRQVPDSGQTSAAGPIQRRLRFVLPQPPQSQLSLPSMNNPSQFNVPLSINNTIPPTHVLRGQNSLYPRSRGPPNAMVHRVDNLPQSKNTWSIPPKTVNILKPNGHSQTLVHSNLMNPPTINRPMNNHLRSVRMRQPSALVVPNNSHQTLRSTRDLPGGANTNTLGCTPRYVPNYETPQQGHLYTRFARPGVQSSDSNSALLDLISYTNSANTDNSTGQKDLQNNLQKQNTQIGNNILETPATLVVASTPQRNVIIQSPRNNIYQSPLLVLSRTPIYKAPVGPPPSYEETVSNSSRQSPGSSLPIPSPPSEEVKKRSENLLRELLSTTADESLFGQPPSPVNNSFRVKLPFTTPTGISTTTTITDSANGSSSSNPSPPSQVLSTVNAISGIHTTVPSQPNIQTSLESLDSGVSQTAIVLVNNTAASTCFVVGQSKSPVVLNQGLAALSSIGQASAMLSSSHQSKFGQRTSSQNENESCVDSTHKSDSFHANPIANEVINLNNSSNQPKNYKFKIVNPRTRKQTKGKVDKKKIPPKAKPKSKGRGRPAKQKKGVYSKSIEIVNLLSSSDDEAPLDKQTNISITSNDQVLGEPDNGCHISNEPATSGIVSENVIPNDYVIGRIINGIANEQTEIGISQVDQIPAQNAKNGEKKDVADDQENIVISQVAQTVTQNANNYENIVGEDVANEQTEMCSSQVKEIATKNANNGENVTEDVADKQAEISSSKVKQIATQNAKNLENVREDEVDTIDLTWIDDMDNEELQREMDFVFVKKEESPEEEQNPNNSSNDDDTIYTTVVVEKNLCICAGPADYNCVCGEAWYCGQECQVKDWASHQKVCHTLLANETRETEEEPINEEVELIDET